MSLLILLNLYLSSVPLQGCNFYQHFPITISHLDYHKNQIALEVDDLTTNQYNWHNYKVTTVGKRGYLTTGNKIKKMVLTADNKNYLLQGNRVYQYENGLKNELEIQGVRDITNHGKTLYFLGKNGVGKIENEHKKLIFNSVYLTKSTKLSVSNKKLVFINKLGIFSYLEKSRKIKILDKRGGKKLRFFQNTYLFLKNNELFLGNSSLPLINNLSDFWVISDRIWIKKNQQSGYWQNGNFFPIQGIRGKLLKVLNNKLLATSAGLFLCARKNKNKKRKQLIKNLKLRQPVKINCKMPDYLPVIPVISWNTRINYLIPSVQFSFQHIPQLQSGQNGLYLKNNQKIFITFTWKFPLRKKEPALIREQIKMQELQTLKDYKKYQRCLKAKNLARRYRDKKQIPLEILIKIEELLAHIENTKVLYPVTLC